MRERDRIQTVPKRTVTRYIVAFIAALVLIYILVGIPLPYFIFQPGTAEVTRPMVHVERAYHNEQGVLMLTTVRVTDANIADYLRAKVNPYDEIIAKKTLFGKGVTEQDYSQREVFMMQESQSKAIQAAYHHAGIPFHIKMMGIEVLQTLKGMPAASVLQAGDIITEINNQPIQKESDLLQVIKQKKQGDQVTLTFLRNQESKTTSVALGLLPVSTTASGSAKEKPHPGIGIVLAQLEAVEADDPAQQVKVDAGNIGGPSAGLMFSLEIYNQLTPQDITKGYRIAGTGEIDPAGHVGVIGGIQHKIVAANREKAEIFFAPKDWYPPKDMKIQPILNTTDAENMVKKIHSKIKIVPVETMDDALKYLANLPPKSSLGS